MKMQNSKGLEVSPEKLLLVISRSIDATQPIRTDCLRLFREAINFRKVIHLSNLGCTLSNNFEKATLFDIGSLSNAE